MAASARSVGGSSRGRAVRGQVTCPPSSPSSAAPSAPKAAGVEGQAGEAGLRRPLAAMKPSFTSAYQAVDGSRAGQPQTSSRSSARVSAT